MNGSKPKTHTLVKSIVSAVSQNKYYVLSFLIPFIILGAVFAFHKVYPFGDRQILGGDFLLQYYPFMSGLWYMLREGTVSTWSWTAGIGHDFVALFAYYMASPLNLLALLLPHAWLRETLTILLMVKIGCAGLFSAMFLRRIFKQNGFALALFPSLYALCAFTMGYYWNIIWYDGFALLPLVALGFLAFMRKGKYRLYICSLALAVLANFYMGFFVCVFVALAFFSLCIIQKFSVRDFFIKLGLIAAYSAIAIGMSAVLALPAFSTLQNTFSKITEFPTEISLYNTIFEILGNFIAFVPATFTDGIPNLYCGMISLLLAGIYFVSPKIPRREKFAVGGLLVFLVLSCTVNVFDYIMHGFHYTNNYPARFTFLISFILMILAYRTFLIINDMECLPAQKVRYIFAMSISAIVFLLAAVLGTQEKSSIIASAVLCVFYIGLCAVLLFAKAAKMRLIISAAFFLLIITELSITSLISGSTTGTTDRNSYPKRFEQMQALLRRLPADKTPNDFYRLDITPNATVNDSALYNYSGVSFFSSTIDDGVALFQQALGLSTGNVYNSIIYDLASPLANAFLSLRYLITIGNTPPDNGLFWERVVTVGDAYLMKNKYHLPLGFMVNEECAGFTHLAGDPFQLQNDLFRRATGLEGNLFMITSTANIPYPEPLRLIMPSDNMLYVYITDLNDTNNPTNVYINNHFFCEISIFPFLPFITTVGYFEKGDLVSFESQMEGSQIRAGYLDFELFEQGYALLADEPYSLTHFSETRVSGTVTALQDGILYTSIPGKNWIVYVDGKKNELLLIDNAMAAVRLNAGTHEVEFRYFNKSFAAGIVISLVSLGVFIVLLLRKRRCNKHLTKDG